MSPELDARLCVRYPKIFVERQVPTSCMARGFECGDGWFNLIDVLCGALQHETDRNGAPQVLAVQVKEKFGTLRFYARGANEHQLGMVSLAENMSGRICEECGRPGAIFASATGYLSTRCAEHVRPGSLSRTELFRRQVAGQGGSPNEA